MTNETTDEEEQALDAAIPDRFGLETAEEDAVREAAAKPGEPPPNAGMADVIEAARKRLIDLIPTMDEKDVLAIFVASSRLEEARLRAATGARGKAPLVGSEDLVKKAGQAIRAARGGAGENGDHGED